MQKYEGIDEQELAGDMRIQYEDYEQFDEEGVVNEQIHKTKHPFNSSELFNAFSNDSFREGHSITGANKWIENFSPKREQKENQLKNQQQLTEKRISEKHLSKMQNNQNPLIKIGQQKPQQLSYQQKMFFGPGQNNNSFRNKSDLIDEDNQEVEEEDINEEENNQDIYYDQEHMMTEQDYEGHQHQDAEEEFPSHNYQQQDNYEIDNGESDEEDELENQDENEDYSQEDKEEVNENFQQDYDDSNSEQNEEQEDHNNSQEANVVESSKSVSPEKERQLNYRQGNQGGVQQSQNLQKNQPTPIMGEYQEKPNRPMSETVEDIDYNEEQCSNVDESRNFCYQDNSNIMNDSCQDDDYKNSVSQNDYKILKNQIVNQSMSLAKPPIGKRMTVDVIASKTLKNQNAPHRNQSSNQVLQDFQENCEQDMNNQIPIRKSLTQNSRSNSEKFNRLQKLEKKNLNEEIIENAEQTRATFNPLQMITKQQSFDKQQQQETFEAVKIGERRQSDSACLRPSQIQQQNQLLQQQQTLATSKNSAINDSNSNDPETELLKREYWKLKNTYNKLKKDPQQTSRKEPSKQGRDNQQNQQIRSQMNTNKSIHDQKIQPTKSKQNLQINNPYTSGTLITTNIEQDPNTKRRQLSRHNKGVFSQQQSSKAKDGIGKSLFKQEKSQMKRDFSKNKLLSRQSPNQRTQRQTEKVQHGRKLSKFHDKSDNDSLQRSDTSYSSPGKSQRRKSQKRQNNITKNQKSHMRSKKQLREYDSSEKSDNNQDDEITDSEYDNQDHSVTYKRGDDTYHNNFSQNSQEHDNSYYDSNNQSQSDYDQEDQNSEDRFSYHSSDENERSSSRKKSKKRMNNKQKHSKKGKKGDKTITAQHRDRKLKININMNGAQFSRQARKELQGSQDEYLQKQRQLLQQQQYLMAMAQQYPQQQLLIQQQLALQQQMLLQQQQVQQINQVPFLNMQPQANNVGLNFDILSQSQIPVNQSSTISNNNSILLQSNIKEERKTADEINSRLLAKNLSGNNLNSNYYNQGNPAPKSKGLNMDQKVNNDVTPSRSVIQNNFMENAFSQITSPRDLSGQRIQKDNSQQQNTNYLNQLKNKFLTGNNQQQINNNFLAKPVNNDQVQSRNTIIQQNNSSPIQRESYKQQFKLNEGYQKGPETFSRFEDARKFAVQQSYYGEKNTFNKSNNQRTGSLMDSERQTTNTWRDDYEKRMMYHRENLDEMDLPRLEQQKTGNFQKSMTPNNELFENARDSSQNNSNCDISIDEGVKASNAHETLQKSPQQEFQISLIKADKMNGKPITFKLDLQNKSQKPQNRVSLNQQKKNQGQPQNNKNDQDKKGPQALMIGFDDEKQLKDPFQNKPQLKPKQEKQQEKPQFPDLKKKELLLRSKSTKGAEPKSIVAPSQQKNIHDKQLRSPIQNEGKKQALLQQPIMLQNQSPLKKVVVELKNNIPKNDEKKNVIKIDVQERKAPQQKQALKFVVQDQEQEEFLDPSHNQNLAIEICDKKGKKPVQQEPSLAEMFLAKKKEAALKFEKPEKQQDQDQYQDDAQDKVNKKGKTKEELFELRKKMMKSNLKAKRDNFAKDDQGNDITPNSGNAQQDKGKKDPKQDLMIRLAMGQKIQIDKKEMKQLTKKNYENLPERKKMKEEEKKKAENMARKQAAQEYMKQLNDKRKALLKKKKSNVEEI